MLKRDKKLLFLRTKIAEIRLAMFKAEADPLLQLPNNIITPLRTDEEGNVWFFTSYKGDLKKMIEDSFPACLEFYKKGSDCRLLANGQASIVKEETDQLSAGKVLVRFRIMHARYFGKRNKFYASVISKLKNFFSHIFSKPQYQEFDFHEPVMQGGY
ncbi:MAG TPA: hypothetical protein PLZ45_11660 [Ferruginibacter sp.]|nr:hypothetical protein [Ferruginibacter sp.]